MVLTEITAARDDLEVSTARCRICDDDFLLEELQDGVCVGCEQLLRNRKRKKKETRYEPEREHAVDHDV